MNIFGVGPLEILLILIIGILALGPEGMVEAGRKLGKFMRSIVSSEWWQSIRSGVDEVQNLPYRLMREAEFEEWNEFANPDQPDLTVGGSPRPSSQPEPDANTAPPSVDEPHQEGGKATENEQDPA